LTTILVDADYLDRMVFDLTVNFERMLMRRIDKLDLSRWVDYVSLDGGLRPGHSEPVQVVMLYPEGKSVLRNCLPANLDTELNVTAVKTNIAEFCFASCKAETSMFNLGDLYEQSMLALLHQDDTNRLLLVADLQTYGAQVKHALTEAKPDQQIMLFAPEAVAGFRCQQEILTYSLMAAMNIRGEELQ